MYYRMWEDGYDDLKIQFFELFCWRSAFLLCNLKSIFSDQLSEGPYKFHIVTFNSPVLLRETGFLENDLHSTCLTSKMYAYSV